MTIEVFCDGLCEPVNPGGVATFGFLAYRSVGRGRKKLVEGEGVVGEGRGMSNNVAEYAALCSALKYLSEKDLSREEIVVKSDSKLLVNQMKGIWSSRKGLYKSLFFEAQRLQSSFEHLSFQWVPREENQEADALSRRAYEKYRQGKGSKFKDAA